MRLREYLQTLTVFTRLSRQFQRIAETQPNLLFRLFGHLLFVKLILLFLSLYVENLYQISQ